MGIMDLSRGLLGYCKCCEHDCIREYIQKNRELLRPYLEEHLDGDLDYFVKILAEMFSQYPQLCSGHVKLRGSGPYTSQRALANLSMLLRRPVHARIILFYTGFDSALSAYGNNIYVGLEWFANPDLIGIREDHPIYGIVKYLHNKGWNFVASNLVHELVHLKIRWRRGSSRRDALA